MRPENLLETMKSREIMPIKTIMRKPGGQEQDELQWRLVPLTQRFPGFLVSL